MSLAERISELDRALSPERNLAPSILHGGNSRNTVYEAITSLDGLPKILGVFTNNVRGKNAFQSKILENTVALWIGGDDTHREVMVLVTQPFSQSSTFTEFCYSVNNHYGKIIRTAIVPPTLILDAWEMFENRERGLQAGNPLQFSDNTSLRDLFQLAMDMHASDIHIEIDCINNRDTANIFYRIDGRRKKIRTLSGKTAIEMVKHLYQNDDYVDIRSRSDSILNESVPQQCLINIPQWRNLRVRFQSTIESNGLDVTMRLLSYDGHALSLDTVNLDKLGMSKDQQDTLLDLRDRGQGILIMVGETGSGKTTTLATLINSIEDKSSKRILLLEDPPEIDIPDTRSWPVRQSNMNGAHDNPFVLAMKVGMRSDVDILAPGEIRDGHQVVLATHAALSGHSVMTSFHASGPFTALIRLNEPGLDMSYQTMGAENLINGLCFQKLFGIVCPHCALSAKPHLTPEKTLALVKKFGVKSAEINQLKIANKKGCPKCKHSGYVGRTLVVEVVPLNRALRALIREGKIAEAEELHRSKRKAKFNDPNMVGKTAFEHGLYKALQGQISIADLQSSFMSLESYELIDAPMKGEQND